MHSSNGGHRQCVKLCRCGLQYSDKECTVCTRKVERMFIEELKHARVGYADQSLSPKYRNTPCLSILCAHTHV